MIVLKVVQNIDKWYNHIRLCIFLVFQFFVKNKEKYDFLHEERLIVEEKNEPNLGPKILKNFGFLSWWKVLTDFVYVLEAVALQVRCKQTEKLI